MYSGALFSSSRFIGVLQIILAAFIRKNTKIIPLPFSFAYFLLPFNQFFTLIPIRITRII